MEFALVNGMRNPPQPKLGGTCEFCGRVMTAKCGAKVIWHWAHSGKKHCDLWWENETYWHRQWKSYFPERWREQRKFDRIGNEWHIADVLTPNGMVVEIQNSPMPIDELRSRENFYGNMIWIVNGAKFSSSFHILDRLPDPSADWVADVVFHAQRHDHYGQLFWRRSENPNANVTNGDLVLSHRMKDIQQLIDRNYVGHHFFDWVRPHSVWLDSVKPVYIDFGDDYLWLISTYGATEMRCVQILSKASVISRLGGVYVPQGCIHRLPGRIVRNGAPIYRGECDTIPHLIS